MKNVVNGKLTHKNGEAAMHVSGWINRLVLGSMLLLTLALFTSRMVIAGPVALEKIEYASLPGNKVQIELSLNGSGVMPKSFSTDNPARIAIDLPGVSNQSGKQSMSINVGRASSVRAVEAGGRTRVVVNLTELAPYETKVDGDKIYLVISGSALTSAPISSASNVAMASDSPATMRSLSSVDFRRGEEGEGRVLVSLSQPGIVIDVQDKGGKVIVNFEDTQLPSELSRRLDVLDFATPVKTIDTSPSGTGTKMVITPVGTYEFLSYQMDRMLTIEFKPVTKQQQDAELANKFPYTGEKLSLNFQDIEVRSVLQLLADFTDMNLVASDSVGGSVTLRLNDVPWDQALDIILKSKGLAKREVGNVLMVGPAGEIAAQEKLELESQKQVKELAPLFSEFIEISYAKASDIATLLRSKESDNTILSPRGGVTIDARTNTLLIQDTAEKLAEVRKIINRLDKPVRQVMIESRIVIANDDFTRDLGVRFGLSGIDQSGDSLVFGGGGLPGTVSPGGVGPIYEVPAGSGTESLLVDIPANSPAGAVQFVLGKIGSSLLQLELSALQTEAKGEVVSSPRVITSDQTTATISQGVEIPFQEASSSGATSTSFEEAELKLEVTPHITPDDRINMELIVTKDSPDFSNVQPGGVPINTQEVETTVLVDNGETVILGGIYEKDQSHSQRKVPFFGDLPAVGFLFKKDFKQDNNRELLFFITPKILKENLSVN